MNKELIKKYKVEFDHWLNGGELLSKHPDEFNWYLVTVVLWNSPKMQYIINDEFVEFRKALAEGKVIQYYECVYQHEMCVNLDRYDWLDWKSATPSSSFTKSLNYRIKPEEPKFKVGDWLVNTKYHSSKPFLVDEIWVNHIKEHGRTIGGTTVKTGNLKDFEIWQPAIGEWCVMYDTEENPNADSITLQKWDGKGKWTPIPFIGQLPPYIKDSDES